MNDENPFFTFEEPPPSPILEKVAIQVAGELEAEIPKPIKREYKKKEKILPSPTPSGKLVEKIIVSRKVDKDGFVCICWADKDTIHPLALPNYDKYKEFY